VDSRLVQDVLYAVVMSQADRAIRDSTHKPHVQILRCGMKYGTRRGPWSIGVSYSNPHG
jgi:hypothetical protein